MEDKPEAGGSNIPTQQYDNIAPVNVQFYNNRVCKSKRTPRAFYATVESEKKSTGGACEPTGSRDDLIKDNLKAYTIYISHCIKPTDIVTVPLLYTLDEKSRIRAEKDELKQTRLAIDILIDKHNEKGRFVQLRDALHETEAYPKIVGILDGKFTPKDQNYIKVLELFTPEIIRRLKPTELLPFLQSRGVFQQNDTQEITAEENNHGPIRASSLLLIYLPRRVTDWFTIFLTSLIKCDLDDLAEMLDPDLYKDIVMADTDGGTAASNIPIQRERKQKPQVAPKPKWKLQQAVECVQSGQQVGEENVLKLIIHEYDVEQIETLTKSPTDRQKIDKCMAEENAEIVWPKDGHPVMIRCTSQDDCEECSEKVSNWKSMVQKKFESLLRTFMSSRSGCTTPPGGTRINKILASGKSDKDSKVKCSLTDRFTKISLCEQQSINSKATCIDSTKQTQKFKKYSSCTNSSSGRTISVILGPLEELSVDVLVCPSDRHFRLNTGLSETLSMKGGAAMQKQCLLYANKYHSMDEADAIVTEPGDLPASHVICLVSPIWREDNHEQSMKVLTKAVMNALHKASGTLKATSISLPAISCGISGFPTKIGTGVIVRAVKNYFREDQESCLKHVNIVDIDDNTVKRFHEAMYREFGDDEFNVFELP